MKRLIALVLVLMLACVAIAEEGGMGRGPGGQGGPGGRQGGGGVDKSSDETLQTMIAEVAPKFQLLTFTDPETGTELQYQLYIPENYDDVCVRYQGGEISTREAAVILSMSHSTFYRRFRDWDKKHSEVQR